MQFELQGLIQTENKLLAVSMWSGDSLIKAIIEFYQLKKFGCDKVKITFVLQAFGVTVSTDDFDSSGIGSNPLTSTIFFYTGETT